MPNTQELLVDLARRSSAAHAYDYQVARLAAIMAQTDKDIMASAMKESLNTTWLPEIKQIVSGEWPRNGTEHGVAGLEFNTSVMEQRTLALAHVLKDHFKVDLSHYDQAIDDAACRRPAVAPNTVSKGIIEPELKLAPGKQLGADDIAAWRRECDRYAEHHRIVMYARADELVRHANRLEQKAADLVDQVGEQEREATLQSGILATLRAHDDGGDRFRYGIESTELKVALHRTRAEHASMDAQRSELESQALRHEATATRRQADLDIESTKILRMERVETLVGQYWSQPGLFRLEQAAIIEQQRLALKDANEAYAKSQSLMVEVRKAHQSADALLPSLTSSRVQLATLELTGKRLLANVQSVERGRMLLPGLDGEAGIGGNSFREILERQRENQRRPISERLGTDAGQEATVAGRSAGMGGRK